jgi:hypothetical protein
MGLLGGVYVPPTGFPGASVRPGEVGEAADAAAPPAPSRVASPQPVRRLRVGTMIVEATTRLMVMVVGLTSFRMRSLTLDASHWNDEAAVPRVVSGERRLRS